MNRFKGTALHVLRNDTRYYVRVMWHNRLNIAVTVALAVCVICTAICAEVVVWMR